MVSTVSTQTVGTQMVANGHTWGRQPLIAGIWWDPWDQLRPEAAKQSTKSFKNILMQRKSGYFKDSQPDIRLFIRLKSRRHSPLRLVFFLKINNRYSVFGWTSGIFNLFHDMGTRRKG